jgi:hypothetical protein
LDGEAHYLPSLPTYVVGATFRGDYCGALMVRETDSERQEDSSNHGALFMRDADTDQEDSSNHGALFMRDADTDKEDSSNHGALFMRDADTEQVMEASICRQCYTITDTEAELSG